ncbi:hypothetical protein [Burkholderia sp. b13]|uniref:hypothetical protein n=1 Tax=Mycetohabitans TaxID=2571159 RepID=UPI001C37CAAB|nr:hypothetical protein [Mycetohabitans sp. B4]
MSSEIVVKTVQHGEFGERLINQSKRTQRMWQVAGDFSNDRDVTGSGHWHCIDGGRLIDDENIDSVASFQPPTSDHQSPTRPGDNTSRLGRQLYRAWLTKTPIIRTGI